LNRFPLLQLVFDFCFLFLFQGQAVRSFVVVRMCCMFIFFVIVLSVCAHTLVLPRVVRALSFFCTLRSLYWVSFFRHVLYRCTTDVKTEKLDFSIFLKIVLLVFLLLSVVSFWILDNSSDDIRWLFLLYLILAILLDEIMTGSLCEWLYKARYFIKTYFRLFPW